jgi:Cu/Ag efflux protein CusF
MVGAKGNSPAGYKRPGLVVMVNDARRWRGNFGEAVFFLSFLNRKRPKRKERYMMKRMIFLVALLTLVAFVSGAMAQQKSASTKTATGEKPKLQKFSGVIEKCDEMAKTIEVKGKVNKKQKTLNFAIDDKTKITKAKAALTLADLKEGTHVSIQYEKDGEEMVAVAIKVSEPKAPSKK